MKVWIAGKQVWLRWGRWALALVVLSACSFGTPQWQQEPAIELPHTVATLGNLQLEIDVAGDELRFDVTCAEAATYDEIVVTANNIRGSVDAGGAPASCAAGETALSGSLGNLSELEVGDELQIGLQVEPPPESQGSVSEAVTYMLGTDGRLRRGAGSVWR